MNNNEQQTQWTTAFKKGEVFPAETISAEISEDSTEYLSLLTMRKLEIILQHYRGGMVVDVCCGNGRQLGWLADKVELAVGIDFSPRYIEAAMKENTGREGLEFIVGDAIGLPLADSGADFLYCLSALYSMQAPDKVIHEFGRVLRPNGRCVIDAGNKLSLNYLAVNCSRYTPPINCPTTGQLYRMIKDAGLRIIDERVFQILPLWTDQPRWMAPLLHPVWRRLLEKRVGGIMLDERISSLPLLRRLAFRHLVVCQKKDKD